jgi:hypothetical protein
MRLHPGTTRAIAVDRTRAAVPLARTAVLPGRRAPWRPPIRLTGLLELIRRSTPAIA